MDDEGKHEVHSDIHLQVSKAACDYSESTDSDIQQHKMYSAESSDCGMSADIPIHCMDDYNVLQGITCARQPPEDVQAANAFCRQGYGIHGHVVKCLPRVKCEERRQELNEQRHVLPFRNTGHETNWTNNANESIQVKQEKKEYTDGYERSSEVTRHWVVCPGGVVKEVKAEHTSNVSDILSGEDCNVDVGCKLRTRTWIHRNNIHDEEMNGKLSTDSKSDVSSTQFRRHDNVLKVQERSSKGVKHLTCDTCGKQFAYLSKLKVHERTHTGVKPFTCDTCGKSFSHSRDHKIHERIHTCVKPFTCDTCGKSFNRSGHLKQHELIHDGVKPFICDTCGKSFSQSGDLKTHERIHTCVKPFICDACGKSFYQSGNLKQHALIHDSVKPFRCGTCGKSFIQSGRLKHHEMIHTCVKPFTCDKSFVGSGDLKRHKRIHTGVKPFTCDTCGKSFARSAHLKRHDMKHEGVTCGKSFVRSGELKRRERIHTVVKHFP